MFTRKIAGFFPEFFLRIFFGKNFLRKFFWGKFFREKFVLGNFFSGNFFPALDRAQRGSVQYLTFMSQYICHATLAGRKAGRLNMNTAQSVDMLSTNKANLYF